MNDYLFDIPHEVKPPEQGGPHSHRRDPSTSRQAAERFKESGKLGLHQQIVLDGVKRCNGGTHSEIAAVTSLDWLQVARRLSELQRTGCVRRGDARTCTVKDSKCSTWWLVDEGRQ